MKVLENKTLCFHCNTEIDGISIIRKEHGVEREYCCNGCSEISHLLLENGLDQFYQIRGTQSLEPIDREFQKNSPEELDNESVYSEYLEKKNGPDSNVYITVTNLHCSACVWLIETVLTKTEGVQEARINFGTGRLKVGFDLSKITLGKIIKTIESLGYKAKLYSPLKAESKVEKPFRELSIRMIVAGFCWGNIMLFSASLYAGYFEGMEFNIKNLFHYISWIFATPVYFYSGYPFWKGAYESWKRKLLGMDTLLFAGVSLAYFYSIYVTVSGKGEVYFDSVCTIYFFILLGKYFEAMIRYKAGAKIGELLSLLPEEYEVSKKGVWSKHSASFIERGDLVRLSLGSKAPVDGILESETAFFDESVLTGESKPIRKSRGAEVKAGSVSLSTDVKFQAKGNTNESSLAQIGRILEDSLLTKPKIQRSTDKLAAVFIKIVLFVAIGTFIYWFQFHSTEDAILNTISVLIVACPCALGLSVPAALVISHLLQSKEGVLVKNPESVEILAKANRIFFDKTGTLTTGKLELNAEKYFVSDKNTSRFREIAIRLESRSSHPIAKSIIEAFSNETPEFLEEISTDIIADNSSSNLGGWNSYKEIPGEGMEAKFAGKTYRIGKKNFAWENKPENDGWVHLSENGIPLVAWEFRDKARPEAKSSIQELRSFFSNMEILSGDISSKVETLSKELGIQNFKANLTPIQKKERIIEAQTSGEVVLMLGDGINDSACIAQADLGISMGMGSDLSLDKSDIILVKNKLDSLPKSVLIARKTRSVILQNICLSLVYNSIMIPLAAGGLMLPVICAGFMTLSSLTVVLNSISLKHRVFT
ncbi:heavy metal translocating P-type ATPase [Leptospira selangorensis]|uniref:Heavy metal translocating P-type ATPase n=1 Tax=Leptospira selangorensis TaxID=2484982 RepID=A0A5F2C1M9_9LEPT|nr:heavy metal translocating P-type ATPase [Leptospira selangorensis]TGM11511.1 heavy metal translocating P-type ATPase [Leptospira selangorensis]TGM21160.1 heavy metal translocating P-type ATPase [Leptospira selangorensis]